MTPNGYMTARETILAKVRHSLRDAGAGRSSTRESEYASIERDYRRSGASHQEDILTLLTKRLQDYDATVYHCQPDEIAQTVALAMRTRNKTSLLRPEGLPVEWLPATYDFQPVNGRSYADIDKGQGVITGCVAAIAFTGTIILQHGAEEGRRALTLIPDYHLCVVFANQVVETVPEGFSRLAGFEHLPLTTVSGPSATADIEMSRVKGVHGPRFLDVILVG